jgi:hypothetical protein
MVGERPGFEVLKARQRAERDAWSSPFEEDVAVAPASGCTANCSAAGKLLPIRH